MGWQLFAEVMDILETQLTATEICVEKVNPLRFAGDGGDEKYEQTFLNFNDAMAANPNGDDAG
jgi:hypothetical protein